MSTNKIFSAFVFIFILSACSTTQQNEWFVAHTGNMPAKERVNRIDIGASKDDVVSVLGLPSSVNVFDQNSWIYMSSDVKKVAFFAPQEVDRAVLRITFNSADEVKSIENLSLAEGNNIIPEKDKTEVKGQRPGFFRKYFGGVGQYTPFGSKNKGL